MKHCTFLHWSLLICDCSALLHHHRHIHSQTPASVSQPNLVSRQISPNNSDSVELQVHEWIHLEIDLLTAQPSDSSQEATPALLTVSSVTPDDSTEGASTGLVSSTASSFVASDDGSSTTGPPSDAPTPTGASTTDCGANDVTTVTALITTTVTLTSVTPSSYGSNFSTNPNTMAPFTNWTSVTIPQLNSTIFPMNFSSVAPWQNISWTGGLMTGTKGWPTGSTTSIFPTVEPVLSSSLARFSNRNCCSGYWHFRS